MELLHALVWKQHAIQRLVESSYEQQILNVVETMDDTKKELSLRLLNEVAQQRGDKDGE